MHLSRWLAAASAALVLAATTAIPQSAQAREIVGFSGDYSTGTVVVKTNERSLYYVLGNGKALRYPVGVGRAGKQWTGTSIITASSCKPAWSPPAEIKRDKPYAAQRDRRRQPGDNPMGAAALTLSGGQYAIHGTNSPARSAGSSPTAASACTMRTSSISTAGSGWGTTVVVTR